MGHIVDFKRVVVAEGHVDIEQQGGDQPDGSEIWPVSALVTVNVERFKGPATVSIPLHEDELLLLAEELRRQGEEISALNLRALEGK